jgi:hypothetical protein
VLWRQAGEVLVLADVEGDEPPLAMAGAAAAVWLALAASPGGAATETELVAILEGVFDVSESTVRNAVHEVVTSLASRGFLEPAP